MQNSNWKNWTLADWNNALVREVFFNSGSADTPITRIDASDRLLAKCIGSNLPVEGIRDFFISCFGDSAKKVRSKYSFRGMFKYQTEKEDQPPIFAHVFLTLLAGSADANSINIGQFRLRFSELFKAFEVGELPFDDLPKFWSLISEWSLDRNKRIGDCRVLHLTYKGRETLIGNSKKLAFPTYADERLLSVILDPDNLDFGQVESAISRNFNSFTDQFKEEFHEFSTFFHKSDLRNAFKTPLWGVVQDLSLESQQFLSLELGSYSIEIFIQHPNVEFYLSADSKGNKLLQETFSVKEDPFSKDDKFIIDLINEGGLIRTLNKMAHKFQDLQRLKLWKQLKSEFIPFFPDEGYLTSKGIFSDGDRCCFLLKNSLYENLKNKKLNFSKKPILIQLGNLSGEWVLLYFEAITYAELQDLLPERLRRIIGTSWRPPQISLRDGAKFGQAYLINPSSNPRFEASKFTTGSFTLSFYNNKPSISGKLQQVENFLRISPKDLSIDLDDASKIEYEALLTGQNGTVSKSISVISKSPKLMTYDFGYSDKWVLPGSHGVLVPHGELFTANPRPFAFSKGDITYAIPLLVKSSQIRADQSFDLIKIPLSSNSNFLQWLSESLSLRFRSRANLMYGELIEYTKDVADVLDLRHARLRNLLFLGGWLLGFQDRAYRSFVPHMGPRTISVCKANDYYVCRIVGLFNQAEENEMQQMLDVGDSIFRLKDAVNILSISAIELRIGHIERVDNLIQAFNLHRLYPEKYGPPLFHKGLILLQIPLERLPVIEGLFRQNGYEWVPYDRRLAPSTGLIVRHKELSKYWVFDGKHFYQVDNEMAAKFAQFAFRKIPFGSIYGNGECIFSGEIFSLPDSLTRWWLHWGGGCISYSPKGEIIFSGSIDASLWQQIGTWIASDGFKSDIELSNEGLLRRQFALKKRFSAKNRRSNAH